MLMDIDDLKGSELSNVCQSCLHVNTHIIEVMDYINNICNRLLIKIQAPQVFVHGLTTKVYYAGKSKLVLTFRVAKLCEA